MRPTSALRLVLVVTLAVAFGLGSEAVAAHYGQSTTYAGVFGWAAGLELVASWALIAAGLAMWQLRPGVTGPLTLAAGFAWFAPDWTGWDGGPTLLRSIGMVTVGIWLALLVHAVLAFPYRRLRSAPSRVLVVSIYAETVIVALARALFRDPFDDPNCWSNCTVNSNSFLVHSHPSLARALTWFDLRFAIVFAFAFIAVAVWRLAKTTRPARRVLAPVLGAGAAVTILHAAYATVLLRTPLEDPHATTFKTLFIGECLAVATVAFALGWTLIRARQTRQAVERLAVELAEIRRPGGLQSALARATRDHTLRIVYRLRSAERYVNSDGRATPKPSPSSDRAMTTIVRHGRPIALIEHDPALLAETFQDQIGSATRLAVENERLQAEALAQLIELRQSRARIVQAGDEIRRRLERDLHDGAQQRLVALSFALRLAAGKLGLDPDPRVVRPLDDAEKALAELLGAIRGVANGLFPATLLASGLAYAVEELGELAPIRIDIETVPVHRLPADVEAAAYSVIREAVENAALHANASTVAVNAVCRPDAVVVQTADDGIGGADPAQGIGLREIADRVGALGGKLRIDSPRGGGTRILAEIPCA
jgi:signal transduction histidine kinase